MVPLIFGTVLTVLTSLPAYLAARDYDNRSGKEQR